MFVNKSCLVMFQHGAVVNVADLWKFTPLHEASAKGKFEICRLLLKVDQSITNISHSFVMISVIIMFLTFAEIF